MIWACIEKRRQIRMEDSDRDGGAGKKKERKKNLSPTRTTCRRDIFQWRTRKTGLDGGVS